MLQDSLLEYAVFLFVVLTLVGAGLAALYLVVRAAVEHGVRRALPDDALRPSVRELLRD